MVSSSTPERFTWATELLQLRKNHTVLEIGCGAGILAECMANKLTAGKLIAIDRSAAMIKKAVKRNEKYIAIQTAEFLHGDFLKLKLPPSHFERIVAFNVNFFRKYGDKALELIRHSLKKTGRLYVFHQAPYELTLASAKPIANTLRSNGFEVTDIQLKKLKPTPALCVIGEMP